MKFTFNQTWKDKFGDAIKASEDKRRDFQHGMFSRHLARPDYQFSKLPTKNMNYVKMLKVIWDNPGNIRVWKDVVKHTNPDKAEMERWGSTTCTYLGLAGMIEKTKEEGYILTPLGEEIVSYCFPEERA